MPVSSLTGVCFTFHLFDNIQVEVCVVGECGVRVRVAYYSSMHYSASSARFLTPTLSLTSIALVSRPYRPNTRVRQTSRYDSIAPRRDPSSTVPPRWQRALASTLNVCRAPSRDLWRERGEHLKRQQPREGRAQGV